MSIESSPEPVDPEQQGSRSRRWQRIRHWLGMNATSQREDERVTEGGNGDKLDLRDENGQLSAEKIAQEIERREKKRRETPPGFPEPLELGPQRYDTPARFWRPDTGGVPLADDPDYQAALKLVCSFPPPDQP